ncbi:Curli production assembly/transport component CsgG [Winogradskyella sp. UBA3174]|uniref:Curli production assembly/transport component CsgG n=1 Tax=Winogradskyella sp. UBA3174 TaxID=1947785 RepID=UPI0025D6E10D|nr:Curli production assembly/transport component CsgG [Winogradskyella sp. UBA3174]|tara:strand:+ start:13433 stop:14143 length:711 start_codon:yes stop_codon:yes gene_type:complete
MIIKYKWLIISLLLIIFSNSVLLSQNTEDSSTLKSSREKDSISNFNNKFQKLVFFDYRGTNVFEAALGSSTLVGGVDNTEQSFYFKFGYKRSILDNLYLGLSFNSFNLSYGDISQDFTSIDFNIEFLALPYDKFSPFIYAGFGYNSLSDSDFNSVKIQSGFGFEYIVADKFGVKLFGEYNYSLEDDMQFIINDKENDSFLRIGFGVNLYFGGTKEKDRRLEEIPTLIKTNSILQDN